MTSLSAAIAEVTRKYKDCRNCGQPVPSWLQKQSDAVVLLGTNYERGKAALMDAMQDELDYLESICPTN